MRCDDFLAWLESGNRLQRLQARRHAKTCQGCAAAQRILAQVKDELQQTEPLPAKLREGWVNAARSQRTVDRAPDVRRTSMRNWYVVAAVAASLLLAIVPLSNWWAGPAMPVADRDSHNVKPDKSRQTQIATPDRITTSQIAVSTFDPRSQLDQLDADVSKLQSDVQDLLVQSERLAAQQQLSQLLAGHQRWQATGM